MSSLLSLGSLWIPQAAVEEAAGPLKRHRGFVLETDMSILGAQVGGKPRELVRQFRECVERGESREQYLEDNPLKRFQETEKEWQ